MVRKIIGARDSVNQMHNFNQQKSLIRQMYLQVLGSYKKTEWRCLMIQNIARPKALFTMQLQCHGRLVTVDRLIKWGLQMNPTCVLCQGTIDTRDHLFGECAFSKDLWTRLIIQLQIRHDHNSTWQQMCNWLIPHTKGRTHGQDT